MDGSRLFFDRGEGPAVTFTESEYITKGGNNMTSAELALFMIEHADSDPDTITEADASRYISMLDPATVDPATIDAREFTEAWNAEVLRRSAR